MALNDNVATAIVEYFSTRERAEEAIRNRHAEIIALLQNLPIEERIQQVMELYWNGADYFDAPPLDNRALMAVLGATQADFKELVKRCQPTKVVQCRVCTRPAIIKKYRAGHSSDDACADCLHAERSAADKVRMLRWENEKAQRDREHREREAYFVDVIRYCVKVYGPITKTKLANRVEEYILAQGNSMHPYLFDQAFDALCKQAVLRNTGVTANHRPVYSLAA